MKLTLISSGLFLLSYLVINRGLGPQPLQLIVPLLAVVGTAVAARWFMRRGRKDEAAFRPMFRSDPSLWFARSVETLRHRPAPRPRGRAARRANCSKDPDGAGRSMNREYPGIVTNISLHRHEALAYLP